LGESFDEQVDDAVEVDDDSDNGGWSDPSGGNFISSEGEWENGWCRTASLGSDQSDPLLLLIVS
jgi:hypothetical protein